MSEEMPRPMQYPAVGERVRIVDGSEAHDEMGVVFCITNDICLIELDSGCIWPVAEPWEVSKCE